MCTFSNIENIGSKTSIRLVSHASLSVCSSLFTLYVFCIDISLYLIEHMGSKVRKCTFGHGLPGKIQIRIFTGCIFGSQGCKVYSCRQQRLIRLHGYADRFESLLNAYVRR